MLRRKRGKSWSDQNKGNYGETRDQAHIVNKTRLINVLHELVNCIKKLTIKITARGGGAG